MTPFVAGWFPHQPTGRTTDVLFELLVHPSHLNGGVRPPLLNEWLNFTHSAVLQYASNHPSVVTPLSGNCPPIALHHSTMMYLRAMSTRWSNTIHI